MFHIRAQHYQSRRLALGQFALQCPHAYAYGVRRLGFIVVKAD